MGCVPVWICILPALYQIEVKERIMKNQLDDYIAKPYNLNTVVDTLNKYISKDGK